MTTTRPVAILISDAAVEAAGSAFLPHTWNDPLQPQGLRTSLRTSIREGLEGAYPILAADVRRQVFAELREVAETSMVDMGLFAENPPGNPHMYMGSLPDWLREQGDRS